MKMKHLLFAVALLSIAPRLTGQHIMPRLDQSQAKNGGLKSVSTVTELFGETGVHEMDVEWQPVMTHVAFKHQKKADAEIQRLKMEKTAAKFAENKNLESEDRELGSSAGGNPVIGRNFVGNTVAGPCPMDNTIAISNGGIVVSLVNSNIAYYDVNGNQLFSSDIYTWLNSSSLPSSICDPKVFYDSGEDRFVLYAQTCDGISANSKVILAFSKSNNPQSGWYLYFLSGNPLGDGSWFDYPKIAVSTQELFVTGNLFYEGAGYNQSVVYQVDKLAGYNGGQLASQYWYSIDNDPFTLLPVSYGQQGTVGPGVLLVSTENKPSGSSKIHLYQITDQMSASNETIKHWVIPTTSYSVGGNATQMGGGAIDTGDNRMMSGFFLDDKIHFVFHSDIGNGWNGINYNRLDVNSLTNTSRIFGLQGTFDYCYPAVASFASSATDASVMIGFERTGASIYPQYRVVNCDNNWNFSSSVLVKSGQSNLSACGTPERWGDYTGISRRHNAASPTVWIAGAYTNSNNYWGNWIAEINGVVVGRTPEKSPKTTAVLFPNPTADIFSLEFTGTKKQDIEVEIFNAQGQRVKKLYQGFIIPGKNIFTFNKGMLADGIYFVHIIDSQRQLLKNEKLVITH